MANFWLKKIRQLGEGGLGVVTEIEVTNTEMPFSHPVGAHFAIKEMHPQFLGNLVAVERFEREIAALKAMAHPSIISCSGENVPGGSRFYVMPLCVRSYRDVLKAAGGRPFAWPSVATVGATIADALAYAHSLGFKHRDIKPENILLDALNNLYVSDWGLGYFIHKESKVLDLTKGGLGTAYYCSLEQWSHGKPDERGDIYSLGMMLAELAEGRQRGSQVIGMGLGTDVVPPTSAGARQFNSLLRQMTAMFVDARPSSMSAVANALRNAAISSVF